MVFSLDQIRDSVLKSEPYRCLREGVGKLAVHKDDYSGFLARYIAIRSALQILTELWAIKPGVLARQGEGQFDALFVVSLPNFSRYNGSLSSRLLLTSTEMLVIQVCFAHVLGVDIQCSVRAAILLATGVLKHLCHPEIDGLR